MVPASQPNPRFRTDLVAEPIVDDGHRFFDVADTDTGSIFRFYEVEYSLACAMDGERDIPKLVSWAQEELGITPTPTELSSVILTLGDLGYLEQTGAPAELVEPVRPAAPNVQLGPAGRDLAERTFVDPNVPTGARVERGTPGPARRNTPQPMAAKSLESIARSS